MRVPGGVFGTCQGIVTTLQILGNKLKRQRIAGRPHFVAPAGNLASETTWENSTASSWYAWTGVASPGRPVQTPSRGDLTRLSADAAPARAMETQPQSRPPPAPSRLSAPGRPRHSQPRSLDPGLYPGLYMDVQPTAAIPESIRRHAPDARKNNFLTVFAGECYTLRRL